MKFLIEKRNSIVEEINNLFKAAETEKRALTEEEQTTFDAKTAELKNLDKTIEAKREARSLTMMDDETPKTPEEKAEKRSTEELEERAFETYLREQRAGEMAKGDNGAVIPQTIANRIIDTVKQVAPIYALTTKFNVKGKLQFPVAKGSITTGYQTEFTDIASSAVSFENVELDGYLIGALSKVSVSLINNAQFDIVGYVVNKIAQSIAEFLEKELIVGATNIKGITDTSYEGKGVVKVETATKDVVAADDLIDTQAALKMNVQDGCAWLMNQKMLTTVRKLKDGNDQYILNPDVRTGFGMELLGKPVMISDEMPDNTVVYGNWAAMYVNIHEDINIRQLNEVYAAQHGVGFVAWAELDAKLVEQDKFAKLTVKTVSARASKAE
mgnify:CR=1 FL=1